MGNASRVPGGGKAASPVVVWVWSNDSIQSKVTEAYDNHFDGLTCEKSCKVRIQATVSTYNANTTISISGRTVLSYTANETQGKQVTKSYNANLSPGDSISASASGSGARSYLTLMIFLE